MSNKPRKKHEGQHKFTDLDGQEIAGGPSSGSAADAPASGAAGGDGPDRSGSVSESEDRPAAGREASGSASSRLDLNTINGTRLGTPKRSFLIVDCKCRSWVCGRCGPGFWAAVGARVMPHLGMFKRPRLLTLTVDPKKFESAQAAYESIRGRIRTLIRLAEFKKGLAVLAFHPNRPSWPHWHILVDLDDCGSWVDRDRMWHLWRDKWGCGGLDLDLKPDKFTATQAARYAISYCQHQAGVVAPWVLEAHRTPRAYELFGELRKAVHAEANARKSSEREAEPKEGEAKRRKRSAKTVAERQAACSKGSSVLLVQEFPGGRRELRYMGRLIVSPARLALAQKFGELPDVNIRTSSRELVNGTQVLEVQVLLDGEDTKAAFQHLENEAARLPFIDRERNARIDAQRPGYSEPPSEPIDWDEPFGGHDDER